jgi:hypothetical protein
MISYSTILLIHELQVFVVCSSPLSSLDTSTIIYANLLNLNLKNAPWSIKNIASVEINYFHALTNLLKNTDALIAPDYITRFSISLIYGNKAFTILCRIYINDNLML